MFFIEHPPVRWWWNFRILSFQLSTIYLHSFSEVTEECQEMSRLAEAYIEEQFLPMNVLFLTCW